MRWLLVIVLLNGRLLTPRQYVNAASPLDFVKDPFSDHHLVAHWLPGFNSGWTLIICWKLSKSRKVGIGWLGSGGLHR